MSERLIKYDSTLIWATTFRSANDSHPVLLSQHAFAARFDEMKAASSTYWIVVIEDTHNKAVMATGTLVIEKKFTHGAGKVRPFSTVLSCNLIL